MKHRADIDGLRAIAIAPVVIYHVSSWLAPGGFVGVDVFFVISGFLITSIIDRELTERRFSIQDFYFRRVRRIFPALFAMLAVVSAGVWLLMSPSQLQEYGRTAMAAALFVSNVKFHNLTGYFDGAADMKPLLHTWSLAVEEQFYIFFPLLLLVLSRAPRRLLAPALAVVALASLALSQWQVEHAVSDAFYLAPSRAFELLIGALLAVGAAPTIRSAWVAEALGLLGLGLLALSIFFFNDAMPFPGVAALAPCLGAALLLHTGASRRTLAARLLSLAPARYLGTISYSLYLWHWPLLVLAKELVLGDLTKGEKAAVVLASLVVAALSQRFIEQPFQRAKRSAMVPIFAGGLGAIATVSLFGVVVSFGSGFPERFPADSRLMFAGASDSSPRRSDCHGGEGEREIPYERACALGDAAARPSIAVWGDSHGAELSFALGEAMAGRNAALLEITSSSCPPAIGFTSQLRPDCAAHNASTLSHLQNDSRIRTVILTAHYPAYGLSMMPGLETAARELRQSGKALVIIYPLPSYSFDVPSALGLLAARTPGARFGPTKADYARDDAQLIAALDQIAAETGARVVRPSEVFCPAGPCLAADEHGPFYFDDDHMSLHGARRLAEASNLVAVLLGPQSAAPAP